MPNGTSAGLFRAFSQNSYKTHVCCVFEPHVLHSETKSTSLVFKLARWSTKEHTQDGVLSDGFSFASKKCAYNSFNAELALQNWGNDREPWPFPENTTKPRERRIRLACLLFLFIGLSIKHNFSPNRILNRYTMPHLAGANLTWKNPEHKSKLARGSTCFLHQELHHPPLCTGALEWRNAFFGARS